jgi:hypothetical protein
VSLTSKKQQRSVGGMDEENALNGLIRIHEEEDAEGVTTKTTETTSSDLGLERAVADQGWTTRKQSSARTERERYRSVGHAVSRSCWCRMISCSCLCVGDLDKDWTSSWSDVAWFLFNGMRLVVSDMAPW